MSDHRQAFSDRRKFRGRSHLKLLHHTMAMRFASSFRRSKAMGDLLIHFAFDDKCKNIAFPITQTGQPRS
jgi:hypothetical protein